MNGSWNVVTVLVLLVSAFYHAHMLQLTHIQAERDNEAHIYL